MKMSSPPVARSEPPRADHSEQRWGHIVAAATPFRAAICGHSQGFPMQNNAGCVGMRACGSRLLGGDGVYIAEGLRAGSAARRGPYCQFFPTPPALVYMENVPTEGENSRAE